MKIKDLNPKAVCITLLLLIVISGKLLLFDSFFILSNSMKNVLIKGDFIVVNKSSRLLHLLLGISSSSHQRKDILAFYAPNSKDILVKRCVGLPGESVRLDQEVIYINDQEFIVYETANNMHDSCIFGSSSQVIEYYMPRKGDVLLLNSNNIGNYKTMLNDYEGVNVSIFNDEVFIDGEPCSKYSVKNDYYFFLGDNRCESLDSRSFGCVPSTSIIGQVQMVLFSFNKDDISNKGLKWNRSITIL